MRHLVWWLVPFAQALGQCDKLFRNVCREIGTLTAGLECLHLSWRKRLLEPRTFAAVDQVVEVEDVCFLNHVGPRSVNLDLLHVRDDQQWRVLECALIKLELLQGGSKVRV